MTGCVRTAQDVLEIKLAFLRKMNRDLREMYNVELKEKLPSEVRFALEDEIRRLVMEVSLYPPT